MKTNPFKRTPWLVAAGLIAATLLLGLHLTARADGPVSARVRVSQNAVLKGSDGRVQLELVLEGRKAFELGAHVPTDFLVILDRSGSMAGDKIANGRAAIEALVGRLDAQDRFGLVVYSSGASLVQPLERATPEARERWIATASSIQVGGGTNMSRGLDVASAATSDTGDRAVRVILISDGLANEGDATQEGLSRRASLFGERGQTLTTIGVGLDFNEYLMSALADRGTGNYYFLEQPAQLAEVFSRELSAGKDTVARGVRVTLRPEPGSGVEVLDAAGYPLERDGGVVSFRPGALFAGQERSVWITYSVPHDRTGEYALGGIEVGYESDDGRSTVTIDHTATIACVDDEGRFYAGVDKEAYQDAVLNEDYGRLKQSVAKAVSEGDRKRAEEEIAAYRATQERMQEALGLEELDTNLRDLALVEQQVKDVFTGDNQRGRQNAFSKMNQAEAVEMRRAGSKKE